MIRGLCPVVLTLLITAGLASAGGILLYLPFDEGSGDVAKDMSGNGNDGTLIDSPKWTDGKFGKALKFEGGNRVEVKASDTLHGDVFKDGPFTFTAWIKPTLKGDPWQHILRCVGELKSTGNNTLFLNVDGRLSWRGFVKGNWTVMCETSPGLLKPDEWSHVAVTGDGKSFKIYVDGKVEAEKPFQVSMGKVEKFCIAFDGRQWNERFSGVIDEVSIWSEALDEAGIKKLMEEGVKSALAVEPDGKLPSTWGRIKLR